MNTKLIELARAGKAKTIKRRRDFHKYAETAWTEFRTASIVAETLTQLGYEVRVGEQVIEANAMMGVPSAQELERQAERAILQGANSDWVKKMQGGKTGVVGILHFAKPGPTVALRFDMDANDANEAQEEKHRPYRQKFVSVNQGAMHACAHDGHTAVGLAVAEVLSSMKAELTGSVKLIFQPAEEGVRGAKAMVEKGVVDDVDYFIGMHFGLTLQKTGEVAYQTEGFTSTTKVDAVFTGIPAHAGGAPEQGRNALLAAANAAINLHAISRSSLGASRINVGVMKAGSGRNVIPEHAEIKLETRGIDTAINNYMYKQAVCIIEAAAAMYGVEVEMKQMGSAVGCMNSPELATCVKKVAERLGIFEKVVSGDAAGGSEDCSCLMERVQQRGGQAVYTLVGTELAASHHNGYFDFNEDALELAVIFLSGTAIELLNSTAYHKEIT